VTTDDLGGRTRSATHATALGTALRILLLIAGDADDVLVTWYETLVADWLPTFLAAEALFMPLFTHVLKLLHSYTHTHTQPRTADKSRNKQNYCH